MSHWVERRWPASPEATGPRRTRAAFRYQAFVPDEIATLRPQFTAEAAEVIGAAERAVVELNNDPPTLGPLEVLARRLLRSESVASSRIEGLELSQRRLAKAEVTLDATRDDTARTVLANIAAMERAITLAHERPRIERSDIEQIHQVLMRSTLADAGTLRSEQRWIGGNSWNPAGADFVPPPPELVSGLIEDLCVFLNRADLPTLAQAAIAHAQFETIHPFSDGNGRVGRALIHLVLRRRGIAPTYVPPVSLVLAGNSRAYIRGLVEYREGKALDWCAFFARATRTAARKSTQLANRIANIQERWLTLAGRPRSDSAAARLITLLPAHPILDVATAQALTERSKQAANEAMAHLASCGVVKLVTLGKRNRAWEATSIFDVLNDFERELATPTQEDDPPRRAPYPGRGHSQGGS